MSKLIAETDQKQNIHRRTQWLSRYIEKQRKLLSPENLKIFLDYNNDMIIHSLSENTRYKNLNHFSLLTKLVHKNWIGVNEEDLRSLVAQLMIKHGENGKETVYTFVLKVSIRAIIRFVKLGSRSKPEDGEVHMLKFIKTATL